MKGKKKLVKFIRLNKQGFTLIELMVVMVIIGLLAATVAPKIFGRVDKARQQEGQAQIELLGQALDLYRLEKHKYPTTDEGLEAIAPYLKKRPFHKIHGEGTTSMNHRAKKGRGYDLVSYGADKTEGGEENNKDIVSWKNFE